MQGRDSDDVTTSVERDDVDTAGEQERTNTRPQRNRRATVKYGDSVLID